LSFTFIYSFVATRALYSFPTRRSSDLGSRHADELGVLRIGVVDKDGRLGHLRWSSSAEKSISRRSSPRDRYHSKGICPSGSTGGDRKSTRLNSSHVAISYAVFCLKKKK